MGKWDPLSCVDELCVCWPGSRFISVRRGVVTLGEGSVRSEPWGFGNFNVLAPHLWTGVVGPGAPVEAAVRCGFCTRRWRRVQISGGRHVLVLQVRRLPVGHGLCITEPGFEWGFSDHAAHILSLVCMLHLFKRSIWPWPGSSLG